MNTVMILVVLIMIYVLVWMTKVSIKRKESYVYVALHGGLVGASVMLLFFLILTWY